MSLALGMSYKSLQGGLDVPLGFRLHGRNVGEGNGGFYPTDISDTDCHDATGESTTSFATEKVHNLAKKAVRSVERRSSS